jgi:hypothetical protein
LKSISNCPIPSSEFFVLRDAEDGGYVPVSDRANLAKPAYDVARVLEEAARK